MNLARTLTALIAAALGPAAGSLSAPANAQQIAHYTTVDEQSIVVDWCGTDMPFRNDFRVDMKIVDRATGPHRMLRHAELNHGVAVWTNVSTQKSITIVWNQNTQDNRVLVNDDGTYSILFKVSGGAKIYGPDGRMVGNAPGLLRLVALFDYAGTLSDPSDDILISETFQSAHGPVPDESECDVYRRLTA